MPMMVNQGLPMMRALILGGTADANLLAEKIAQAGLEAIYSYGGRTRAPAGQKLPIRIGGFGGAGGLADYLRREGITHVIDATHPFAAEMSRNAVMACAETGTPLLALERAPWVKTSSDNWIDVADITSAVAALPERRARVFLAIGRQHISPSVRGRSMPIRCGSSILPRARCHCPMPTSSCRADRSRSTASWR